MKKHILVCALLFTSSFLFAQSDFKAFHFGLGGTFSLPVGTLKDNAPYGAGFELQASYLVSDHVETFLQSGVNVFKGRTDYASDYSILHVPIVAGARYKLGDETGFFAGAGLGYGIFKSSYNDASAVNGFLYSPQIGYDFGKGEILFNYTATAATGGTLSYIGIKLFRKF